MKIIKRITLLITIYVLAFACKEEEYVITCENGPVKLEYLPNRSLTVEHVGDKPDYKPNFQLIIQSQAEYEYYLKPAPAQYLSAVDFKRKTLLVVRSHEIFSRLVNEQLIMNCEKKEILWQINATRNDSLPHFPEFALLTYYVVVPKIPEKTKLFFEVNLLK